MKESLDLSVRQWLLDRCPESEILDTADFRNSLQSELAIIDADTLKDLIGTFPRSVSDLQDKSGIIESILHSLRARRDILGQVLLGELILEIYLLDDRWDDCLGLISEMTEKASEAGMEEELSILLNYRGVCLYRLAKYTEARDALEESLKIAEKIGNNRRKARAHINLGLVHKEMGRLEEAASHYKIALKISKEDGDERTLLSCYLNIGNIYREINRWDEGRKALDSGIKLAEKLGNQIEENRGKLNLGVLYLDEGKLYSKAEELFLEVINHPAMQESNHLNEIAKSNLALTLVRLKKTEEAIKLCTELLENIIEPDDFEGLWRIHATLARAYALSGEIKMADEHFSLAQGIFERLAKELHTDRDRAEFQRNLQNLFTEHIDFALNYIGIESAFGRLATGKARALTHDFQADITEPEKVTKEILDVLRKNPNTAILDFFISDQAVRMFLVNSDGIKMAESPNSLDEIESLLSELQSEINLFIASAEFRDSKRFADFNPTEECKKLYEALIKPIEESLKNITRLYIVLTGNLYNLPIFALADKEDFYLIEKFAIGILPSSEHARQIGQESALPGNVTVLKGAQNSLEFFKFEENALRETYGDAVQVFDFDSISSELKARLSKSRIIHFSGHAEFDVSDPFASGFVLDDGTRLRVDQILDSELDLSGAVLVSLAGCETGRGRILSGDEMVGISRPFLAKGASAVISSLWKIDDNVTALIMCDFYSKAGNITDVVGSFRDSILKLLKETRHHPYFFAPFQIMCRKMV